MFLGSIASVLQYGTVRGTRILPVSRIIQHTKSIINCALVIYNVVVSACVGITFSPAVKQSDIRTSDEVCSCCDDPGLGRLWDFFDDGLVKMPMEEHKAVDFLRNTGLEPLD